ncbi:DUF4956 domain-containing protein [Blastopirellula marina]|uniref:DUF4956 domain-containing protein n=1 Tax=Blastopirellula marina TaxID=124 RepID=A0A2S8GLT7_9BACT|nr:DUF4956 domain-containing protein [Blastopirellula marina]PQO45399.1 DUF4956 domain-containing protein [Blastopirellula marina]
MEFLEVPLFDADLYKLLVRFGINLIFLTMIVVFGIYPSQARREFAFTAVMLNIIVFFICFTMKKLELDLGLALGLFAVFGVLRYRTDAIRPKEMTYLFIVIGIAVINSLANKKTSYAEVMLVNSVIFASTMLKERFVKAKPEDNESTEAKPAKENGNGKAKTAKKEKLAKYTLEYDHLQWLGEDHRETLLNDLRQRTGLDVVQLEIKTIDLPNNKATLIIWIKPVEAPPENETS